MRWSVLLLTFVSVAAIGCISIDRRPTAAEIVRSLAPPAESDGLIVESMIIEQGIGDPFLDRELWSSVLPVGTHETRALLEVNGLRVGLMSGSGPTKFQALLSSESDTISPRQMTFRLRKDTVLPTAGPIETCKFAVRTDLAGEPRPLEFKQARLGVEVRPELATDGRVKLWIEPQLQHGERQLWLRPNEDATQFSRQDEVPIEKFAGLGCEAILGRDDYLLIGWDSNLTESLGQAMFTADASGRPRQRVLVIRARFAGPIASDLPPIAGAIRRPSPAAEAGAKMNAKR